MYIFTTVGGMREPNREIHREQRQNGPLDTCPVKAGGKYIQRMEWPPNEREAEPEPSKDRGMDNNGACGSESIISSPLVAVVLASCGWRGGRGKQKRCLGIIIKLMLRRKSDKIIWCGFMIEPVAKKESKTTRAVEY